MLRTAESWEKSHLWTPAPGGAEFLTITFSWCLPFLMLVSNIQCRYATSILTLTESIPCLAGCSTYEQELARKGKQEQSS